MVDVACLVVAWWRHVALWVFVNIGSDNGLLPNDKIGPNQ